MNPKRKMERRRKKVEKKKLWNSNLIMGLIFIGLMVFSVFAVVLGGFSQNNRGDVDYNGTKFLILNNGYATDIEGQNVFFSHLPQEVLDINISEQLEARLTDTLEIDVTTDIDAPLKEDIAVSIMYLTTVMEQSSNIYIRQGFTEENEYNITRITCADATPRVPVFVYEYSNTTGITEAGNCAFIRAGSAEGFNRITSRIIYTVLGII
jgi:hypothetical protein